MKFFSSFQELTSPLAGKPALVASLTLMATITTKDAPQYGAILLILLWALVHVSGKFLQKVILMALLAGMASILVSAWTHSGIETSAKSVAQAPPSEGCGTVEAVLPRSNGVAFIVQTTNSNGDGDRKNGANMVRVRLTEKRELPLLPEPGDSLCYEAAWYPVEPPTVPGAFDTRKWLEGQGLTAYGKLKHWKSWRGSWNPERSFYHFRNWIKARLSRFLDQAETGLLMGLLAGDRSGIPEALRSDFQRSGLVHVLAISGFHVVLLAGLLMTGGGNLTPRHLRACYRRLPCGDPCRHHVCRATSGHAFPATGRCAE